MELKLLKSDFWIVSCEFTMNVRGIDPISYLQQNDAAHYTLLRSHKKDNARRNV